MNNTNQLTSETIQEIQQLLNNLEIKKQNIQNEITKLQTQIEMQETQKKQLEEELKQYGIIDLSQIDEIINQKQNDILNWIEEVKTFLNDQNV